MAAADPLNGLKNRRCLEIHLGTLLDSSCAGPLSAMILDLDGFKAINDRYGHEAGDRVLRCFAARPKEMIRETDLLSRLGGDEFVVVMPGTDLCGGFEIAERCRATIASDGFTVAVGGHPIAVTVSAGLAESTGDSSACSCAVPTRRSTGRNRTAAIAFRSVMRGIDRKMAGWPMEQLEIAERDPRSGKATLRRAGHRTSWKLPLARGGEAVTAMIGG